MINKKDIPANLYAVVSPLYQCFVKVTIGDVTQHFPINVYINETAAKSFCDISNDDNVFDNVYFYYEVQE